MQIYRQNATHITVDQKQLFAECAVSYQHFKGGKGVPRRTEETECDAEFPCVLLSPKQAFGAPCGLHPVFLESSLSFEFIPVCSTLRHTEEGPALAPHSHSPPLSQQTRRIMGNILEGFPVTN